MLGYMWISDLVIGQYSPVKAVHYIGGKCVMFKNLLTNTCLTLVAVAAIGCGIWDDQYGGAAKARAEAISAVEAHFDEPVTIIDHPRVVHGEVTVYFQIDDQKERLRADVERDGTVRINEPDLLTPSWVSWGSWQRIEERFAAGTMPCVSDPSGGPELLFAVHRRGSSVMKTECFEATTFKDQSGDTWLYATVAMVHSISGEIGMMNYIVDPDTGELRWVKPDYKSWAETDLTWRPGQVLMS